MLPGFLEGMREFAKLKANVMPHLRCRASIGYSRDINVSTLDSEGLAICVLWKEINARFSAASGSEWEMRPEVENRARKFPGLCERIGDIYFQIKIQCAKMFMTRGTMKTCKSVRVSFSGVKNCATCFSIELLIWNEIKWTHVWALRPVTCDNVANTRRWSSRTFAIRVETDEKLFTWLVGKCKATIEGDDDGPRLVHA